jgi:hypothetical protein
MNDEPCTREHLQAAVSIYYMYDTQGDGELGDHFQEWDNPRDAETGEIEEYHCGNCCEYFTPSERFSVEARVKAWQAALDHLKTEKVPA